MKTSRNLSVSNLAFYAEDPQKFASSRGSSYNASAAELGTQAHERIGRGPSKLAFILILLAVIGALFYFKILV